MDVFFKKKSDFRTIATAIPSSFNTPIFSNDNSVGSFQFPDKSLEDLEDCFLLMDGKIWIVDTITPNDDGVEIRVADILNLFYRSDLDISRSDTVYTKEGDLIRDIITQYYIGQTDTDFDLPYLQITGSDDGPVVATDLVDGIFVVTCDYLRKVCKKNTTLDFSYTNDQLILNMSTKSEHVHQFVIGKDSELKSKSFDRSIISKVTVFVTSEASEEDSGSKVEDGILVINFGSKQTIISERHHFYLGADGKYYDEPQTGDNYVHGRWEQITIPALTEEESESGVTSYKKAREAAVDKFETNTNELKLEFYSNRYVPWGSHVRVRVDNGVYKGKISSIVIDSSDDRYLYTMGDLKVTLTDKLKTVL